MLACIEATGHHMFNYVLNFAILFISVYRLTCSRWLWAYLCVPAGQAGASARKARDAFVDFLDRIPDQLTIGGGAAPTNSTRTGTAFDQSRPDLQNAAPRT